MSTLNDYMDMYEAYIQANTHDSENLFHNDFITSDSEEGYKLYIYQNIRFNRPFSKWKESSIGSGDIARDVRYYLDNCSNLIDWHTSDSAAKAMEQASSRDLKQAERFFYNLYRTDNDDISFEQLAFAFGKRSDLIAYLFFLKDRFKYLPISPTNFDRIFNSIGITTHYSRNLSWDNYCNYIDNIKKVQAELQNRYPSMGIDLLDAHSFLWIIGEKKFEEFFNNESLEIKMCNYEPDFRDKDITSISKARIGQYNYRKNMLELWNNSCAVTGCKNTSFLIASHAKPWKDCNTEECRNPYNGLPLIPNLDLLFDKGLISFDENGYIMISTELSDDDIRDLGLSKDMHLLKSSEENEKFMKYHRETIFKN